MTDMMTKVPLTQKEGEAIMWCLGQIVNYPDRDTISPSDPLAVLLKEGFSREDIMKTGEAMFEIAYGDWLSDPMTDLEKAILRVCVENSTWVEATSEQIPHLTNTARVTLRGLAAKLEAFGIEVSNIAND